MRGSEEVAMLLGCYVPLYRSPSLVPRSAWPGNDQVNRRDLSGIGRSFIIEMLCLQEVIAL